MKIKFDQYDAEQRLHGLKRLNLVLGTEALVGFGSERPRAGSAFPSARQCFAQRWSSPTPKLPRRQRIRKSKAIGARHPSAKFT